MLRKSKNGFTNPFAEFPREVGVMVFASFFVAVGFGIIAPVIPLFAKSFGVSNAQVGAILSAFALARFASGLISGKLVDKFGERLVYTVGIDLLRFHHLLQLSRRLIRNFLSLDLPAGLAPQCFQLLQVRLFCEPYVMIKERVRNLYTTEVFSLA